MQNIEKILPLYFVAGSQDCRHLDGDRPAHLLNILEQALKAGITCYQFRDKEGGSLDDQPELQFELAKKCRALCKQYDVPFIMNDNVEWAIRLQADGIHVGQSDMDVSEIRKLIPKEMILGLSCNKLEEAKLHNDNPLVDYYGIGPIFPTFSKEKPKPTLGTDFVRFLREQGITKPFVAIGGVTAESANTLRQNGATGVALISAITRSENIAQTVADLLK